MSVLSPPGYDPSTATRRRLTPWPVLGMLLAVVATAVVAARIADGRRSSGPPLASAPRPTQTATTPPEASDAVTPPPAQRDGSVAHEAATDAAPADERGGPGRGAASEDDAGIHTDDLGVSLAKLPPVATVIPLQVPPDGDAAAEDGGVSPAEAPARPLEFSWVNDRVRVHRVARDSSLHPRLQVGDHLVSINEEKVHTPAQARGMLRGPGTSVIHLTVERGGRLRKLRVERALFQAMPR